MKPALMPVATTAGWGSEMAPTKADPLYKRMLHAFGHKEIEHQLMVILTFDCLTDEARDELLRRCIRSHKLRRKFAAESRKLYRERAA